MLPNILQSHAPVFTGKERRLDSRFSSDNLHPFTPHQAYTSLSLGRRSCTPPAACTRSMQLGLPLQAEGQRRKNSTSPTRPPNNRHSAKMLPVSTLHTMQLASNSPKCLDRARVSLKEEFEVIKNPQAEWSGHPDFMANRYPCCVTRLNKVARWGGVA